MKRRLNRERVWQITYGGGGGGGLEIFKRSSTHQQSPVLLYIWIYLSLWTDKWFAKPFDSVIWAVWLARVSHYMWDESSEKMHHCCSTNIRTPYGFALLFSRYETVRYRHWWPPKRLLSWSHKRSNPSLAYHPTCEGTPLQVVGPYALRSGLADVSQSSNMCTWSLFPPH